MESIHKPRTTTEAAMDLWHYRQKSSRSDSRDGCQRAHDGHVRQCVADVRRPKLETVVFTTLHSIFSVSKALMLRWTSLAESPRFVYHLHNGLNRGFLR